MSSVSPSLYKCNSCEEQLLETMTLPHGKIERCPVCHWFVADPDVLSHYAQERDAFVALLEEPRLLRLPTSRQCVRCFAFLMDGRLRSKPVNLMECTSCKGIWTDFKTIQKLDESMESALRGAFDKALTADAGFGNVFGSTASPSDRAPSKDTGVARLFRTLARSLDGVADGLASKIPKPETPAAPPPRYVPKVVMPQPVAAKPSAPSSPAPIDETPPAAESVMPIETPVVPAEPAMEASAPTQSAPENSDVLPEVQTPELLPVEEKEIPPAEKMPEPELPKPSEPVFETPPASLAETEPQIEAPAPTVEEILPPPVPETPSVAEEKTDSPPPVPEKIVPVVETSIPEKQLPESPVVPAEPVPTPAVRPPAPFGKAKAPAPAPFKAEKKKPVKESKPAKEPKPAKEKKPKTPAVWPTRVMTSLTWIFPAVGIVINMFSEDGFDAAIALGQALMGWSVARFLQLLRWYPWKKFTAMPLTEVMQQEVRGWKSLPVIVTGEIVIPDAGRPKEAILRDGSISIALDRHGRLEMVPKFFGISGFHRFVQQPVTIKGWYRHRRQPVIEVLLISDEKRSQRSLVREIRWVLLVVFLIILIVLMTSGN